jgi:copper chaperone CopZ
MEKTIMSIPNISCDHCVMTIKNELKEIEGILHVEGDSQAKEIKVDWQEPASLEKIKEKLAEINYPAA